MSKPAPGSSIGDPIVEIGIEDLVETFRESLSGEWFDGAIAALEFVGSVAGHDERTRGAIAQASKRIAGTYMAAQFGMTEAELGAWVDGDTED